jgi:3,4-dihydroxyphenylacetate 2,3-dioxygenase
MGEIVGAAFVAHVPTIVLPETIRRELNEGQEISLVPSLHGIRRDYLDPLNADTFVVFDTHWFTTVEFIVAAHQRRHGKYTSEELPRGMSQMPYDFPGDAELAHALATLAEPRDDMWIHPSDDPYLPIHYPTVNLLQFLQRDERWMSMGVCQTGEATDFLLVGQLLADAITALDRRVVLLASGGMSHTFWSLQELRHHEASDPVHVRSVAARAADEQILKWWADGDHRSAIEFYDTYRQFKPEGRFAHYLMMIGALGGAACRARGIQRSDYENSAGTAQVHVTFDRPDCGWTGA